MTPLTQSQFFINRVMVSLIFHLHLSGYFVLCMVSDKPHMLGLTYSAAPFSITSILRPCTALYCSTSLLPEVLCFYFSILMTRSLPAMIEKAFTRSFSTQSSTWTPPLLLRHWGCLFFYLKWNIFVIFFGEQDLMTLQLASTPLAINQKLFACNVTLFLMQLAINKLMVVLFTWLSLVLTLHLHFN